MPRLRAVSDREIRARDPFERSDLGSLICNHLGAIIPHFPHQPKRTYVCVRAPSLLSSDGVVAKIWKPHQRRILPFLTTKTFVKGCSVGAQKAPTRVSCLCVGVREDIVSNLDWVKFDFEGAKLALIPPAPLEVSLQLWCCWP